MEEVEECYLGFDISTQQLKAIILDNKLNVLCEESVVYDTDLPEFRTQGGVNKHGRTNVVTCNPLMWIKSLDLIMDKLKITGCDLYNIRAISGSSQQHGTVYWRKGANKTLANLDSSKFLHTQLQQEFTVRESPVWQDSSTENECNKIEQEIGGASYLAEITGSRAYCRYSASQILKLRNENPTAYEQTERISLISSFAASLFLGDYAPIDYSDGSGMNLMNIKEKKWCDKILNIVGGKEDNGQLCKKLGNLVKSNTIIGKINKFFVERYSFNEDCQIVAFTGDNSASIVGLCLKENDIAISLGTSDTVIMWLTNPCPTLNGHILVNPLNENQFMGLICFKNGSKTRERISKENAESNWDIFNELLESTPRGNFGNIGLYFDLNEIYPVISGDYRFNKFNEKVARFSKEVEVRACVEGQFIRLRAHAENLGFTCPQFANNTVNNVLNGKLYDKKKSFETRIIVTGGASSNKSLLQVLSDVFNCLVYVQERHNSACIGSALMAKYATNNNESFNKMVEKFSKYNLAAKPSCDADHIYSKLTIRYREIENKLNQLIKYKSIN